jgi:hypothetical protein
LGFTRLIASTRRFFALLEARKSVDQTPPHGSADEGCKHSPEPLSDRFGGTVHLDHLHIATLVPVTSFPPRPARFDAQLVAANHSKGFQPIARLRNFSWNFFRAELLAVMERTRPEWLRRFGAQMRTERASSINDPLPQLILAKLRALEDAERQSLDNKSTSPKH